MRHWYMSLWMGGALSAGWVVSIQPADQAPPNQSDKYQCRIDTVIFSLMMGTWVPETCREET
jgi:hypothetical protein